MDGRNSFGRRISLLNDDVPTLSRKTSSSTVSRYSPSVSATRSSSSRLPSFAYSRSSSSGPSTPCLSPQTPPLIRSNSLDSSDMDVPSPLTPEYHGDSMDTLPSIAHSRSNSQLYPPSRSVYFNQQPKEPVSYPPMASHTLSLPYPHQHLSYPPVPQAGRHTYEQLSAKQPSQPESGSRSGPHANRTKKGQHPCPLAKQFNCSDTFTTSGHASRHAKKHTGEKSAICPDCGKDFTRKDNMEQHRKTHLNGRNANKGRVIDAKSAAAVSAKRPKPSPLQSSGSTQLDSSSSLSVSPATPLSRQQQLPQFVAPSQEAAASMTSYPDPASCGSSAAVYPGLSHDALHTLASAASGRFVG